MDAEEPRMHGRDDVLARKLERLDDQHVRPLNELAREIRRETGEDVPWFDPGDGGVDAEVLVLLEAPGRRASSPDGPAGRRGGTGVVSVDNADSTAEALWHLLREAGLPRDRALVWNVVPWYLGDVTTIRPATPADLATASPWLERVLALLPRLQVAVTLGEKSRRGWLGYLSTPGSRLLPTLAASHPSPQVLRIRPDRRAEIRAALARAAAAIDARSPTGTP